MQAAYRLSYSWVFVFNILEVKKLRLLLAACVAVIVAQVAFSHGVRHINVRDGLSSRQVYEIEEDGVGYIWVYSNAGLDRFDGHNAIHYSLDDSRESNDHILWATTMLCDNDGVLWVAQMPGDIYRYDRRSDRFVREYVFSDPEIRIYNFTFSPDSSVLVCTNKGLYGFRKDYEPHKLALDDILVTSIISDGKGAFFAGTEAGVYHIAPEKGYNARFVPGTQRMYVKSLASASGKLFIGTFSRGVFAVEHDSWRVTPVSVGIPLLPINALEPLGNDSLLIGIDGAGVYLIDSHNGRIIRHFTDDESEENYLSGNTVTDVHVDSNSGIWIATSHRGVTYVPLFTHPLTFYRAKRNGKSSLLSDYANAVFEDTDSNYWIGTDKGLSRHSRKTGEWRNYLVSKDFTTNVILTVTEDENGHIWVGTYGNGVSVIDRESGEIRHLPLRKSGETSGLATECVFAIASDTAGYIWMGGINGDITRYNPDKESYSYYAEDCLSTIVKDSQGNLLFCGNKGVGRYNAVNDSFSWTCKFDTVEISYPVRCLLDDGYDGKVWIGTTGDGLICYDRKNSRAKRYTTDEGLSANTVYSVVRDKSGYIWVSTETDLYRYNPESDKLVRLTYYLGNGSGSFNPGAGIRASNGDLLFGTADGCLVFNPQEEIAGLACRDILFTDFKIGDVSVSPGEDNSPLEEGINVTDRIVLSHSQNTFEIGFNVINFASPRRIGFEYNLEKYDREFIPASGYSAKFSDIPPGSYTLTVRAVDLFTGKQIATRSLDVVVEPPLWLTWWAKLIYVFIIGGFLAFAISYLKHYRREKRIEGQIQSFATVAHDIRTPISLIKGPLLNIEIEKDLSQNTRDNLQQARAGIDKAMEMLSEMLELRDETNIRSRLQVEPIDIKEFLQVKAEEYAMLAKFKGICIEIYVAPDMPQVYADTEILSHIVDNLLSNALKYTKCGVVSLSADVAGGRRWSLSVKDTGMGIAPEDAKYIFKHRHRSVEAVETERSGIGIGLLITRRLVATHQGRITFDSVVGKGTTFIVKFPLRYDKKCMRQPLSVLSTVAENVSEVPVETSSRRRIVVVEDDADMLGYLRKSLSGEYDIQVWSDSLAAFEAIRNESPDLVITDLMMPKLRGDELCRMVKTDMATSHIPVILLSGLASREDIIAGFEAHADDYIVKPFDIVLLKARIRNIIKLRAELNQRVIADNCEPETEDFTNELDREFMTRVIASVETHLSDSEFSIGDLCSDLCMSRTSVYNKIKSLTGQSLNEFIRIMRLNRSKELLQTRRYNISEVAYMVGFSDPKYFSTCFKKQFGISPSKL